MAYLWIYFLRSYRNAAPAAPTSPKNKVLEGFYIIYIFLSFALLAAGIGSGYDSTFGSITITAGITQVQATRNHAAAWPIGKGYSDNDSGAVSISVVTVTSKDRDGTGLTGLNFATSSTGGDNLTWTLTSTTAP